VTGSVPHSSSQRPLIEDLPADPQARDQRHAPDVSTICPIQFAQFPGTTNEYGSDVMDENHEDEFIACAKCFLLRLLSGDIEWQPRDFRRPRGKRKERVRNVMAAVVRTCY
jgi:hypothetical protein